MDLSQTLANAKINYTTITQTNQKIPLDLWEMLTSGTPGKRLVAFITLSIMVTCGMTNAGFILLAITGEENFDDLNWKAWETIVGTICAVIGGVFSGYAQKSIYLQSLNDLEAMYQDGLLKDLQNNQIALVFAAAFCAVCSFLVNFGLASLGIGVLIGTGTPLVLFALSFLFAIANALLVFFTALDAIHKGILLPDCFKTNKGLGIGLVILFTAAAAWGLAMNFYPGVAQIIGDRFKQSVGVIIFGLLLGFALITELYYSFTKACHLAYMLVERKFPNKMTLAANLFNAAIAAPTGMEGGVEFAADLDPIETDDDDHKNSVEMTTLDSSASEDNETTVDGKHSHISSAFAGAGASIWSMTCSTESAPEKKELLVNQYKLFQNAANQKSTPVQTKNNWIPRFCF